ncbi:heavy-metal-associated domain-containing protein [Thiothrix winogradskyi]|uniref:Heavy-metal-associated domain-containing protein n=1 Tax=Thiothrix winogradskyi TaxID=96472 RepID=A0ABY3T3E9_9GAMM|nr:heavy metal-associated domain-containing protein [Thiothrix winogradskyi]UJS26372.1 heavy-metal-associated domain-containing protein [Thiothrix winogradskyi]
MYRFITCLWMSAGLLWSVSVDADTLETTTLAVSNMTCSLCPITIKKALSAVEGVDEVTMDLATKTAQISYNPEKTTVETLVQATTQAGFPSTPQTAPTQ